VPYPLMMKHTLALAFLFGAASALHGQALPTASRVADAQVGAGYSLARPDYLPQTFQGFTVYGDLDFRPHLGVEAEFHQVDSTSGNLSYERTYEVGGRYFRTYGALVPYVKAMIGRGDFQYPFGQTELAYTLFAGGVGADFKLGPYLRVRAEYEFQKWTNFPNGGFTPQIVTFGVAYHFAGKPGYK
jgi:opacity protein-like surface antigen